MQLMKDISLVLFDLDLTLVDSLEAIVESFSKAAEITGIRINVDKLKELIGRPFNDVIKGILPRNIEREKIEEFIATRRRIMDNIWRSKVRLYSDVEPVIRKLREMNIFVGVASSSSMERLEAFLDYFGLKRYLNVASGVKDGVRGKPYPDVILYAIRELGIPVDKTIYVGDAEVDCIAARRAGVRFVRILRGVNTKQWRCRPDHIISSLWELLDLINDPK